MEKLAEYYASGCGPWSMHHNDSVSNLGGFDPANALGAFITVSKSPVLEGMGTYFELVAVTMVSLSEELNVELVHGEMTDFMDRVRFDALDYRSCAPKSDKDINPDIHENI